MKGLRPDDLYEAALDAQGLRSRWEETLGGEDKGRDLFAILAWDHVFLSDKTWIGQASGKPGLGKRYWTYVPKHTEPAATVAFGTERKVELRVKNGDCALWDNRRPGSVIGGPREVVGPIFVEQLLLVRFRSLLKARPTKGGTNR